MDQRPDSLVKSPPSPTRGPAPVSRASSTSADVLARPWPLPVWVLPPSSSRLDATASPPAPPFLAHCRPRLSHAHTHAFTNFLNHSRQDRRFQAKMFGCARSARVAGTGTYMDRRELVETDGRESRRPGAVALKGH